MHGTQNNTGDLSEGSSPMVDSRSDKQDEYQAESESILEALEVSENGESPHRKTDVEKGGVAAAGDSNQPTSQALSVQDWDGPNEPENPQKVCGQMIRWLT